MANILIYTVQIIGILVPFIGCISLLRRVQNRPSIYLLLANLGCLIINGSYLLLLQTESYDGALAALKMEYFGNVFLSCVCHVSLVVSEDKKAPMGKNPVRLLGCSGYRLFVLHLERCRRAECVYSIGIPMG